jgi:hypothetical protein
MALFTKEQLAAYLQKDVSEISDGTYEVLEQKIRVEIINIIGQARFDSTDELRFFSVALDMAQQMGLNPSGLRSVQESIDDWSTTETYAAETVGEFDATTGMIRRIRKAAGMKNAFSIAILDPS